MGERAMEGAWPHEGGEPSNGAEVWPSPVECLMNGMIPSTTSDHLLFGTLNPILPPQFRPRFPHSDFSNATQHAAHHHHHHGGPISLSINIPSQHPMGESASTSSLLDAPNDPPIPQGPEVHVQPLALTNGHHVLDETDEESEEDDDDMSDEEMDDGFAQAHNQQVSIPGLNHQSLTVDEESLPSCQHGQVSVISGDSLQQQARLLPRIDDSCHGKNNLFNNGLSHGLSHDEDIPSMSQGHPLNSNPISAIPMISQENSLLMSNSPDNDFSPENRTASSLQQQLQPDENMEGDPNIGHSVHGKMYVEGRVVFHLKQWTDSGFVSFNSCREQEQQKMQLHGCAVCRLKSPACQGHDYRSQQKEAHRHPVKGVLHMYQDCIMVELYPAEQHQEIGDTSQSLDPKQNEIEIEGLKRGHPMPISSYLTSSLNVQNQNEVSNIVVGTNLSLGKVATNQQPAENESQQQLWWPEFDSEGRNETEAEAGDSNGDPSSNIGVQHHQQSSCIMNLKMQAETLQNIYEQQQQQQHQQQSLDVKGVLVGEQQQTDIRGDQMSFQSYKLKCDQCSLGFLTDGDFESHRCLSDTNVSEVTDEPSPLEPQFSTHQESVVSTSINAADAIEVTDFQTNEFPDTAVDNANSDSDHPDIGPDTPLSNESNDSYQPRVKEERVRYNVAKYPCPVCSKSFHLKKLLKQHLEEKHHTNPFRCVKCQAQYADEKRLKRHSCTLSVQDLKSRLQAKREKTEAACAESPMNLACDEVWDDDVSQSDSSQPSHSRPSSSLNRREKSAVMNDDDEIDVGTEDSNVDETCEERFYSLGSVSKTEKSKYQGKLKKKKKFRNGKLTQNKSGISCFVNSRNSARGRSPAGRDGDPNDEDLEEDYESQTRYLSGGKQQNSRNSTKAFRCNMCDKAFTVERRLLNHKQSHKTDRSSQCEKCGKRFARKDKLMRHMYVHSEEKMFVCNICDKRFSRRDKLSDHLKSHGSDVIHNCPMCQKQFVRPDILKQHVKLHRMGNKHQCPECLRFVTGEERLAKHMARHEEAKALGQTLLCPLCTKYFIQRQSLKAHIKKFHPEALYQLDMLDAGVDIGKQMPGGDSATANPGSPTSSTDSSGHSGNKKDFQEPTSPSTLSKETRNVSDVTTVCLLLDDVMGSCAVNKTASTNSVLSNQTPKNPPKRFSCQLCPQSFMRDHALKKHMELKHSPDGGKKSQNKNDGDNDTSKVSTSMLTINRKCEESNPSSLSSLSPSTSPTIPLLSMASILQNQHNIELSHVPSSTSQVSQQGLEVRQPSNESQLIISASHHHHNDSHQQSNVPGMEHQSLQHPQQAHLSTYSQHLALASIASIAAAGLNGGNSSSLDNVLQSGGSLSDVVGNHNHSSGLNISGLGLSMGHHHQQHPSTSGNNISMGLQSGGVMCPTPSYILNYPAFHYQ